MRSITALVLVLFDYLFYMVEWENLEGIKKKLIILIKVVSMWVRVQVSFENKQGDKQKIYGRIFI